jgi:threonine dehydrogenase-like Zn-dependent dehydrogenase
MLGDFCHFDGGSVNPGFAGGAYGYVAMGPYQGGQAQYLRVPYADFNGLKLPKGTEHEADFILLADIFPTGWHGLTLAGFKPGETVAVFGAGMYPECLVETPAKSSQDP